MAIEINRQNLERAIARCFERHPRVSLAGHNSYRVDGSTTVKSGYLVYLFYSATGKKCATCDCAAGQAAKPLACYHIAAAMALHCARVRANPDAAIGALNPQFCKGFNGGFRPDALVDYDEMDSGTIWAGDEPDDWNLSGINHRQESDDAAEYEMLCGDDAEDLGWFDFDHSLIKTVGERWRNLKLSNERLDRQFELAVEADERERAEENRRADNALCLRPETSGERVGKIRI